VNCPKYIGLSSAARKEDAMTLVRVNESNSGGDFIIVNLQMVTRAECRNFDAE
jgi:hypothetical protein